MQALGTWAKPFVFDRIIYTCRTHRWEVWFAKLCFALKPVGIVFKTIVMLLCFSSIGGLKQRKWLGPSTFSEGTAPTWRMGAGFTAINDRLYLFGGYNYYVANGGDVNDLFTWDTASSTWSELTGIVSGTLPSKSNNMGFTSLNGKVYLFGGEVTWGETGNIMVNTLYEWSPSTMVWKNLDSSTNGWIPITRSGPGFAALEGKLYLFGGVAYSRGTNVYLNDFNVFDPTEMRWMNLSDAKGMPSPRNKGGFESCEGMIYLWGGNTNHGAMNDFYVFDPALKTWSNVTARNEGPEARYEVGFTSCNGRLYLFGGQHYGVYGGNLNDLFEFDPATLRWRELITTGTPPSPRYNVAITSALGSLYILGGSDVWWDYFEDFFRFDTSTMEWTSPTTIIAPPTIPFGSNMGLTSANDSLFSFGGQLDWDHLSNAFHIWDPSSTRWTDASDISKGTTPSARAGLGFTSCGSNLYVFGGQSRPDNQIIHNGTMQWTNLTASATGTIPPVRSHMGFSSLEGCIFVFGGKAYNVEYNDLYVWDPSTMVWTDLTPSLTGELPSPRFEVGFTSAGGMLYLLGGQGGGNIYADLYQLDLNRTEWMLLSNGGDSSPPPIRNMGLASFGLQLYVFGGKTETGFVNTLYQYDLSTMTWALLSNQLAGSAPSPRAGSGIAVVGTRLYILGGKNETSFFNDLRGFSVPQTYLWPLNDSLAFFARIFDWDTVIVEGHATISLPYNLGQGALPCVLNIRGIDQGVLHFIGNSSIACFASAGCSSISLRSLTLILDYTNQTCAAFSLQESTISIDSSNISCQSRHSGIFISGQKAIIRNVYSSFTGCSIFELSASSKLTMLHSDISCSLSPAGHSFVVDSSELTAKQTTMKGCPIPAGGGLLKASGKSAISLESCNFSTFYSTTTIMSVQGSVLNISNSDFVDISTKRILESLDAADVSIRSAITLEYCRFSTLHSTDTLISVEGSVLNITNSDFLDLSTNGILESLGAADVSVGSCLFHNLNLSGLIFSLQNSSLKIKNSEFSKIEVEGSLLQANVNSTIFFETCLVHQVIATSCLIVVQGCFLNIASSTFSECSASGDGAVVHSYDGANISIHLCHFGNMKSKRYGGALSAVGSSLNVSNSEFQNCSSKLGGGAIWASGYFSYGSQHMSVTTLRVEYSSFINCTSLANGGAVLASRGMQDSGNVLVLIASTTFLQSKSSTAGGAVSAIGVQLLLCNTTFNQNSAAGLGGGALHIEDASVTAIGSTCSGNEANVGGGGALLWQGNSAPQIIPWCLNRVPKSIQTSCRSMTCASSCMSCLENTIRSAVDMQSNNVFLQQRPAQILKSVIAAEPSVFDGNSQTRTTSEMFYDFCGPENKAAYGDCYASDYKYLDVVSNSSSANPGIQFNLLVSKMDAYKQVIVSDYESIVRMSTSSSPIVINSLVLVSGSTSAVMKRGVSTFLVAVHPVFSKITPQEGLTVLESEQYLYFQGTDSLSSTCTSMISSAQKILFADGDSVCPQGYILQLDNLKRGTCMACGPGTYSLLALAGYSSTAPSCLKCPAGATSCVGNQVLFTSNSGKWTVLNGMYILVACPTGYKLVNTLNGIFSPDSQYCQECQEGQYILDSNNSNFSCQICPVGAICKGNVLSGKVLGSVWKAEYSTGIFILVSCPPGYELLSTSPDTQQCALCPATYFCIGGAAQKKPCPSNTFSVDGSNISSSCASAEFVRISLSLPIALSVFSASQQLFISALAVATGVNAKYIILDSVSPGRRSSNKMDDSKDIDELKTAWDVGDVEAGALNIRTHYRGLGIDQLAVVTRIATKDLQAAQNLVNTLSMDVLNSVLTGFGFPPSILTSATIQGGTDLSATPGGTPLSMIIGISLGSFFFIWILLGGGSFTIWKLRKYSARMALLSAFREAKQGDAATQKHLPFKLQRLFEAQQVMGRGAFGFVVRAKTNKGGQIIAIKIVIPQQGLFTDRELRQLRREAAVLDLYTSARCDQAVNLVGLDAVKIGSDVSWFVMELVSGYDMEKIIKDSHQGPVSDIECIKIGRTVLGALKLMHSNGLVHRDIKPANIMRSSEGSGGQPSNAPLYVYKLVDFGTALGIDEKLAQESMMTLSSSRQMGVGTLPYMSPEMFTDPENALYPTDLWSLGVTMFELVTGILPFRAENDLLMSLAIAGSMDEKAPNVLDYLGEDRRSIFDNNLTKAIGKALEKKVCDRFQSSDEMHEALYCCLISRNEAAYSVFISYRVASEAPFARLLFDELNHSVTPGGHRVTVYWDVHRLLKGRDWQESFSMGLLHSLCFFPILSYGSTAPLADLPAESRSRLLVAGWEECPCGRKRLSGTETDADDNVLKEFLIASALKKRRQTKSFDEKGLLQIVYPILVGRQHPKGHPNYPQMGSFFDIQGGGGIYARSPSTATNKAVVDFLKNRAFLPENEVSSISDMSIASIMQGLTSLQGCQMWEHPSDLTPAQLTLQQKDLVGKGCTLPAVNLGGVALTYEQQELCKQGFDEAQLRMLKAQIRHKLPYFHQIIDDGIHSSSECSSDATQAQTIQSLGGSSRWNFSARPGSLSNKLSSPFAVPVSSIGFVSSQAKTSSALVGQEVVSAQAADLPSSR